MGKSKASLMPAVKHFFNISFINKRRKMACNSIFL